MKSKIEAALVGIGLYAAVLILPFLPDRLILFPTTAPIHAGSASRKTISFESGELEIWSAASPLANARKRPDFYLLRFYGNADRAENWVADEAAMWPARAVEVWGMNYPGFGGSSGPARLAAMGPAALTAFDALQDVAAGRPIIVFGTSFGTVAALHIAANRPVAGVVLQNPPAIRQMILGQFGWWNLWLLAGPLAAKVPAALDSVANAGMAGAPAVFLQSEKDEVVPPRYQALMVEAYRGEKRIIPLPGATHNSSIDDKALSELRSWLDWLLRDRR